MKKFTQVIKNSFLVATAVLFLIPSNVYAAYDEEFYSGNDILFYNPDDVNLCATGNIDTSGYSGASGGYTIDQVKAFAASPITSTWNLPDTAAEQWFLKQSGARATIAKYKLTSSNIGEITSVVKATNVSPVFFYLYTVNEGGGAGGFINHYKGDVAGGGVANAKRDAEYLVTQSQVTNGKPATGGGEPVDMPTAEAQQILSALPAGSVGIVYIQATSAVTAELEDLSGKTGSWSGKYNKPLSDSMRNISTMGGDPAQSGATISSAGCTTGITGEGMTKGINWAKMIAENNGYGYDQSTRTSGWTKWQSDPNCTTQCGSLDCSSFISAILTTAGYYEKNPNFTTASEEDALKKIGFVKVASSAKTSEGLQPGDILHTNGHTEMYIGNNQNVGAHENENHGITGGKVGDQTGNEISIGTFYDGGWDGVWRAPN